MPATLKIKTSMDNKDFDKKYSELTKQLDLAQQEQEMINRKTEKYKDELDLNVQKQKELEPLLENARRKVQEITSLKEKEGYLTSEENRQLEKATSEFNRIASKSASLVNQNETLNDKIEQQNLKYQKSVDKISKIEEKTRKLETEQDKLTLEKFSKNIDNIGNKMTGIVQKASKWAIALIGIRTGINLIRSASSTVLQYNDELANKVDSIKYTLAMSLEPIISRIVNWVYKLIQYVNYLAQAWFGVNLFANASSKAASGIASSTKSASKSAKELKKQLAGFDTANVLSDSSSDAGGSTGGVSGGGIGAMELLPQGEVPSWLQWILDHKEEIIAGLSGIALGLTLLKLGLDPLMSLGIGLALAGIVYSIEKIIDFLNDPTFENFIGILEGIAVAIVGVAIAIGAWPVAIGAAIAFVIIEIVKHFDEIMNLFDKLIDWLDTNVLGALRTLFGPLGDILYAPIKFFVELAKGSFEAFYGGIKQVIEGVMKIFKGDFWGGIKDIFGGLLNIMTAPLQGFLNAVRNIIPLIMNFFVQIGTKVGEVIGGAFKGVINGVLSAIESILNFPIRSINSLIGIINSVPGVSLGKLSTFNLPRLKVGGIINNPGRGVPIGGAIGGEAGREGVLPLTDNQTMADLGKEIGKWVKVYIELTNKIDSRVLSRIMKQINMENSFARNGG